MYPSSLPQDWYPCAQALDEAIRHPSTASHWLEAISQCLRVLASGCHCWWVWIVAAKGEGYFSAWVTHYWACNTSAQWSAYWDNTACETESGDEGKLTLMWNSISVEGNGTPLASSILSATGINATRRTTNHSTSSVIRRMVAYLLTCRKGFSYSLI